MRYLPETATLILSARFPGVTAQLVMTTIPDRPYRVSNCIEALHSTEYWHYPTYWQAYAKYKSLLH